MEQLNVLNDANEFDRILQDSRDNGYKDGGDLRMVMKEKATVGGKPAVVLTFTIEVDGELKKVQTVTTLSNLVHATTVLQAMA
jgi:hypothetical protein